MQPGEAELDSAPEAELRARRRVDAGVGCAAELTVASMAAAAAGDGGGMVAGESGNFRRVAVGLSRSFFWDIASGSRLCKYTK